MLMTEEQARTKWCPKYQVCGSSDADNRQATGANCIASGCMAWRKVKAIPKDEAIAFDLMETGSRLEAIKQYRFATGCTLKEAKDWSDAVLAGAIKRPATGATLGYCGAFGKAED